MGMVVAAVVETTSTRCFELLDHALVGEQREVAIYRSPADAAVVAPDLDEHIVGGRMVVVQGSNGIEDESALPGIASLYGHRSLLAVVVTRASARPALREFALLRARGGAKRGSAGARGRGYQAGARPRLQS